MTRFSIALLIPLLFACHKNHEKTEKLAKLCGDGTEMLKRDAKSASSDDFISILSSTLQACSQACDGDDAPSCKQLGEHLSITCKSMPDMCQTLCTEAKSTSLREQSCELAKTKR
jgi:hypothetical protein